MKVEKVKQFVGDEGWVNFLKRLDETLLILEMVIDRFTVLRDLLKQAIEKSKVKKQ